jgi:hypothetical protein
MTLKKGNMFSSGNASAWSPSPRSMTFRKSPRVVELRACRDGQQGYLLQQSAVLTSAITIIPSVTVSLA